MKFLGYLRIQHLHKIILSPTDQSDDMDFVEKNATFFTKLIQYLNDKSLSLVIRDAQDNRRKGLTILREHHLSKRKPKVITLYKYKKKLVENFLINDIHNLNESLNVSRTYWDSFSDEKSLRGI